jgi:hypothetical protein
MATRIVAETIRKKERKKFNRENGDGRHAKMKQSKCRVATQHIECERNRAAYLASKRVRHVKELRERPGRNRDKGRVISWIVKQSRQT